MRLAFIIPRYGLEIGGGAERLVYGFAREASRRGWSVEIWTSCADSYYTWENHYPPGQSEEDGVVVWRFPISYWPRERQGALNVKLDRLHRLSPDEQYEWLACGPHSQMLYEHVRAHHAEFDVLIALPYLMPMVNYAAWIAPERTIIWPCMHDEIFAYMEPFRLLLEGARGVIFNSFEEQALTIGKLAMNLPRTAVIGVGATLGLAVPALQGDTPYLLYIGRLEKAKNLTILYEYVSRCASDGHDLKLLLLGEGAFKGPEHPAIEYLGFLPEADKAALCAGALAVCQPSLNESFSLAVMESWLAGRPVLVHHDCAVTCGHVRRSAGGLWFRSYGEFVGAIDYFRQPEQARRMGRNGRRYVLQNFTWPVVVDRFATALARWPA